MLDIQGMMDAMSASWAADRSKYHLTLGKLIAVLEPHDPALPVTFDYGPFVGSEHSYRGYYSDLSFEPSAERSTVADVLARAKAAIGNTYEGYKGGDFVMRDDTPLWCAHYGNTGSAIIGASVSTEAVILETKNVD